jgi:Flp pilus assembly protein TadD
LRRTHARFRPEALLGESIPAILLVAFQLASIGTGLANQRSVTARADSLYFAGNLAAALAVPIDSGTPPAQRAGLEWRAARALIAMGMMQPDGKERRALYDDALVHARRAWSLTPDNIDARYWVAAAAGRRTHRTDPIYSARLGREVYEQATAILAIDSMHAGAHHALGMLHAEVLRVPAMLRIVAGRTITNGLPRANEREAELHLRRAVELEPTMMIYLVDLANFYIRRGRAREAEELARRIATTPSRHPMDDKLRANFAIEWRRRLADAR